MSNIIFYVYVNAFVDRLGSEMLASMFCNVTGAQLNIHSSNDDSNCVYMRIVSNIADKNNRAWWLIHYYPQYNYYYH